MIRPAQLGDSLFSLNSDAPFNIFVIPTSPGHTGRHRPADAASEAVCVRASPIVPLPLVMPAADLDPCLEAMESEQADGQMLDQQRAGPLVHQTASSDGRHDSTKLQVSRRSMDHIADQDVRHRDVTVMCRPRCPSGFNLWPLKTPYSKLTWTSCPPGPTFGRAEAFNAPQTSDRLSITLASVCQTFPFRSLASPSAASTRPVGFRWSPGKSALDPVDAIWVVPSPYLGPDPTECIENVQGYG